MKLESDWPLPKLDSGQCVEWRSALKSLCLRLCEPVGDMGIKDIFLLLDPSDASKARLSLAASLARRHDARLVGACVIGGDMAYRGAALGFMAQEPMAAQMLDEAIQRTVEATRTVEQAFHDCLRREGLNGVWVRLGDPDQSDLPTLARTADLVVLGQQDAKQFDSTNAEVILSVLLDCGGPTLVVPFIGAQATLGASILVAWDNSREAARAIHDALPFLRRAQSVTLLSVWGEDEPSAVLFAASMAAHLARHGVTVTTSSSVESGLDVSDILLDAAADFGSDLLVAGAYGHSPLHERVLGGVTRDLLAHMTIPMLFSH